MKKVLSLMAVVLLTGTLFAQTPNLVKQVKPTGNVLQLMNTRAADTITTYLDRSSHFYIYGVALILLLIAITG